MDGKRKYSLENLQNAIKEKQQNDSISILSLAKKYNIPEATLHCHYKNPQLSLCHGPSPLLTKKEENALVEHVSQFTDLGLKISSAQFIAKGSEIMEKKLNIKTKLGRKWFYQFRKRNLLYSKKEKKQIQNT